jgi:hypothetical protein
MLTDDQQSIALVRTVVDLSGAQHYLDLIEPTTLQIDGWQVNRVDCQAETITFYFQSPEEMVPVTCSPAALWEAIAGPGGQATAQEAGYLLAQVFAFRLKFQHVQQQCSVLLDGSTLVLPPYREQFDLFIEEYLLTRCSGTIEDLEAIAHVGNLPMARLLRWAAQHGKTWPLPAVTTEPLEEASTASQKQDAETPTTSLAEENTSDSETTVAAPDLSGGGADELTEENASDSETTEVSTDAKDNGYFHWSEERINALKSAFSQSNAANPHAASVEIAQRFGWPEKTVYNKVRNLHLPGQKLMKNSHNSSLADLLSPHEAADTTTPSSVTPITEEQASSPERSTDEPLELGIGPHVWTVTVDGASQIRQWRLPYAYRTLPEQFQGKEIRYEGMCYQLERIFTSHLNVSAVAP